MRRMRRNRRRERGKNLLKYLLWLHLWPITHFICTEAATDDDDLGKVIFYGQCDQIGPILMLFWRLFKLHANQFWEKAAEN